MFDLNCGTDRVRTAFMSGKSANDIWSLWNKDASRFRTVRRPYLLYT